MNESGLKWRQIARKEHFGETRILKLSKQKNAFKALLQNKSSSDLQFRYFEVREAAALPVKTFQKTVSREVWSLVGFQLYVDKQSILADQALLAWEKFKYYNLHQGFNWEHPQG